MKTIPWICVCLMLILFACERHTGNIPDAQNMKAAQGQPEVAQSEALPANVEIKPMANDETPMKWRYSFREKNDPEAMAVYAEAENLVKDMRTYEGSLDGGSHLGSWYVLSYPDPPMPEHMPTDASGPVRDVFLVNMESRKAVTRGDWATAGPFFIRLALYEDKVQRALPPGERRVADINIEDYSAKMLASFASLVAFGHQLYWREPVAEKTPEGALVVRYDVPPSGSTMIAKHCKFTVTDEGVAFESEDYQID